MKKINKQGKAVPLKIQLDCRHIKKCPWCGAKITKYKEFYSKDKSQVVIIPDYPCECYDNRRKEHEAVRNKERAMSLLAQSNIDDHFKECKFPITNKELKKMHMDLGWVTRGAQVFIYGRPGNYKTTQTTIVAIAAINKGFKVLYYRASALPSMVINDRKLIRTLVGCDLLILDNFGKERAERTGGIIFDILDKRIHKYKANILICNNSREQVSSIYSGPLLSRLEGFIKIEMDGDDKRKNITYGKEVSNG